MCESTHPLVGLPHILQACTRSHYLISCFSVPFVYLICWLNIQLQHWERSNNCWLMLFTTITVHTHTSSLQQGLRKQLSHLEAVHQTHTIASHTLGDWNQNSWGANVNQYDWSLAAWRELPVLSRNSKTVSAASRPVMLLSLSGFTLSTWTQHTLQHFSSIHLQLCPDPLQKPRTWPRAISSGRKAPFHQEEISTRVNGDTVELYFVIKDVGYMLILWFN